MSSAKTGDLKEAQRKIQYHIDELEVKIKNSKAYWHHCEYHFDRSFVLNFIDSHYNEIVNHVAQIKHHLEQISFHKNALDDVKINVLRKSPVKWDHNEQKNPFHDNVTPRRSSEDKQRFKNLRASRCSSSKYVNQWEKMIDEHKEDTPLNVIKRRPKGGAKSKTETSGNDDVSKKLVKGRVIEFEKNQKYKRTSSTIENFLDVCVEKPARGVSCPIIEEIDELTESERPKSHDLETASGDNGQLSTATTDPVKDNFENCENTVAKKEILNGSDLNSLNELEDVFKSCVDVHQNEELLDKKHLSDSDLKKLQIQVKTCVCNNSTEGEQLKSVNEDNFSDSTIKEDFLKMEEFVSCKDVHPKKPSKNHLKNLNEDKPNDSDIKEDLPKMEEDNINSTLDLDAAKKLSKAIDEDKPATDSQKIHKNNSVKHTEEELSNNNHTRDIIEDKPVVTESKLELLDDVNALIEDDHLKIIKKKKVKPNQQDGDERTTKEESSVTLPMEEASNSSGSCDKKIICNSTFTKPRIIGIHRSKLKIMFQVLSKISSFLSELI